MPVDDLGEPTLAYGSGARTAWLLTTIAAVFSTSSSSSGGNAPRGIGVTLFVNWAANAGKRWYQADMAR